MPVKEMSQEDQQALRELVNEFGQQRDAAKTERDRVAAGFQRVAWPIFRGMIEEVLNQVPKKIESAPIRAKVDEAVGTSKQVLEDKKSDETVPEVEQAAANPVEPRLPGTEVDEPMPDQTEQAEVTGGDTAPAAQVPTQDAEIGEEITANQTPIVSDGPTAMDVDGDKAPEEVHPPSTDVALPEQAAVLETAAPVPAPIAEAIPLHPDEILPENRAERRKLVGQRLRSLETGLQTVSSTTDELARKFEKLEEQVLFQEEQLNDYLDSRSLEIDVKDKANVDGETKKTGAVEKPPSPKPTETVSVGTQPPLQQNAVDMETIDAIRAEATRTLDDRLQQLAQAQDLRLAEIAQAQEARLTALGTGIRSEIQAEAARAEQAYANAIEAADDKAGKLEAQLAVLQAELTQFKQERKIIEDIIKQQSAADQLIKTIRESTLKAQLTDHAFRNNSNNRLGEIDDRLTAHNNRLTEHSERLVEHTTRLAEHDAQLRDMSTFEKTKEAWRSDMIDMKNHVVGRVDYLEEQVESIKKPLVAARLTTQAANQAASSIVERSSSPATSSTQRRQSPATPVVPPITHQASSVLPPPAQTAPSLLSQTSLQPVHMQPERTAGPPQSRASPVDTSSNRLTLNRVGGAPGTALNSAASLSHISPAIQTQFSGQNRAAFGGYANGVSEHQFGNGSAPFAAGAPTTHNPGLNQTWRGSSNSPVVSQPAPAPARSMAFHHETEQSMRSNLSNLITRPTSNGSLPPNVNATSDSALGGRLNGGQYQRPEPTPAPLLPLHMRMHSGTGVSTGNWMQPNGPSQQGAGSNGPSSPATSEGAIGGRLGARMFDPGESKPPPPP